MQQNEIKKIQQIICHLGISTYFCNGYRIYCRFIFLNNVTQDIGMKTLKVILCFLLHYAFAILLSYASAWISYQNVKIVGGTTLLLFPLVFPRDILMVNVLFYPLGLAIAVIGCILLSALHRKIIEYIKPVNKKAYKVTNTVMLVLSCILSIGAAIFAYLNTIFRQGELKYEVFFAGISTNIVPIMMIILFIRNDRHLA